MMHITDCIAIVAECVARIGPLVCRCPFAKGDRVLQVIPQFEIRVHHNIRELLFNAPSRVRIESCKVMQKVVGLTTFPAPNTSSAYLSAASR